MNSGMEERKKKKKKSIDQREEGDSLSDIDMVKEAQFMYNLSSLHT